MGTMTTKRKGLGRGLEALIQDGNGAAEPAPAAPGAPAPTLLPVEQIRRSPLQPRTHFDSARLEELAASIQETGIVQPLVVRAAADGYELVAGERRLRAAGIAGLTQVPVVVVQADDRTALEMALVENLQRENLDPIEEAEGYAALAGKFNLTQDAIATRVGKARATVANALRLLELPAAVQAAVSRGELSAGHAKALSALADADLQQQFALRAARESLSVRQLEQLVRRAGRATRRRRVTRSDIPDHHLHYLEERLHHHLGTRVRLEPSRTFANGRKAKGSISIDYFSSDELDRILAIIGLQLDS